jgi:hypothetical protein
VPLRVEAYTVEGVLRGVIARAGHLRDVLESSTEILVERSTWTARDGAAGPPGGEVLVAIDDVVLAVTDEDIPGPVHAAWHPIRLEAGPYVIRGDLATMPGFDPGRALTRPTGTFVLLSGVRIALADRPDGAERVHAQVLVNRYTVEAVEADIMLGFFFPGARMDGELDQHHPPVAAPPAATAPPTA